MVALLEGAYDVYDTFVALIEAPKHHLLFEAALIIWIIKLIFSSRKPQKSVFSKKEEDELLRDWNPEPLVPDTNYDARNPIDDRIIESKLGKYVVINEMPCLNLATLNFLGMVGTPEIEQVAIDTVSKYGVGTCGPRGFYGTTDKHLQLESKIAKFMAVEEAISYSYGFSTIASAIPAYSKRGDIIFCDKGVNFAIQKGILASRSIVRYFNHNDMSHLEDLLDRQQLENTKDPKKARVTRTFVVVEGIYFNHGTICNLPKLVELKSKHKFRIFIDESISFGTLGHSGRGLTEYYNISVDEIDLIIGSLENSLGSIGGFACGKSYVVDHQRLSGYGYAFSASQPTLMVTAAIEALDILEHNPHLVQNLTNLCEICHHKLLTFNKLDLYGDIISPVKHLVVRNSVNSVHDRKILQSIVEHAQASGIALVQAEYLDDEMEMPEPSIRITLNSKIEEDELISALSIIESISDDICPELTSL